MEVTFSKKTRSYTLVRGWGERFYSSCLLKEVIMTKVWGQSDFPLGSPSSPSLLYQKWQKWQKRLSQPTDLRTRTVTPSYRLSYSQLQNKGNEGTKETVTEKRRRFLHAVFIMRTYTMLSRRWTNHLFTILYHPLCWLINPFHFNEPAIRQRWAEITQWKTDVSMERSDWWHRKDV